MVELFIQYQINMPIGRSQIPQQIEGKLRGAKPTRAMLTYRKKKKNINKKAQFQTIQV